MRIEIRPVLPDDAAALLEIYAPWVKDSAVSFEETVPTVTEMRERIQRYTRTHPWLVALDPQKSILGYAYASSYRERGAYRWVTEVSAYVREGGRRAGVGKALYARLMALLREQGFTRAYAVITLPNEASARFHESLGFRPFAVYQQVGFKRGAWHDVGWWEMELRPLIPGETPEPPLRPSEA